MVVLVAMVVMVMVTRTLTTVVHHAMALTRATVGVVVIAMVLSPSRVPMPTGALRAIVAPVRSPQFNIIATLLVARGDLWIRLLGNGYIGRRISDGRGLLRCQLAQGCWGAQSTGHQEGASKAQK